MIYHTSAVRTFKPVFTAFAKKYGITVRNFYATGTPLSVRFASEVASGIMQADVFYSSDTSIFQDYPKNFQLLNADTLPNYKQLPDNLGLRAGWQSRRCSSPTQCSTTPSASPMRSVRARGRISPIRNGRAAH